MSELPPPVSALAQVAIGVAAGLSAALPAAEPVIDLWPAGRMPGTATTKEEHLLPTKGDGVDRVTDVSHPTLTLFRSPGRTAPGPAVVVCPGGGYGILAFNKEGTDIATWLNGQGVTAVVLKYRVPDNREGAFQDIQRAVRVLRSRAAEWAIDPARVGVMGFSAGGHLSARASTDPTRATYAPLDEADAIPCRPDFAILVYPAYLEKGGALAPELPVGPRTPPTFIVHTEDDKPHVPGSKVYHAALEAAKVPNEFQLFATGGHGYGMRSQAEVKVWPERLAVWLAAVTKPQ